MIKISFEIQQPDVEFFTQFVDYDFLLAHKVFDDERYKEFFKKSTRYKIMDNSAFELPEPLPLDKIVEAAVLTDSHEIVIPDVIGDPKASMEEVENCLKLLADDGINNDNSIAKAVRDNNLKIAAVVQGNTIEEWLSYFKALSNMDRVDRVCIPFALKFVERESKTQTQMDSRLLLTSIIDREKLYNPNKKYHLLGCSNPIEMKYQSQYSWIDTLDTSSPIQQAVCGNMYDSALGVPEKDKTKVDFDYKLSDAEIDIACYNIGMLKGWCNAK